MSALSKYSLAVLLFGGLLLGTALPAFAGGDSEGGDPDAVGHSADGYYLNFDPLGHVELPRLFLIRNADGAISFDVFGSTHAVVESGEYDLIGMDGEPMNAQEVEETLAAHAQVYFQVVPKGGEVLIDFSITRQLLFVFISALLVLLIGLRLAARYKKGIGRETAPRGTWQNMMESLIIFLREDIAIPSLGEEKYKKYFPYIVTVFLFILLGNLIGLIPFGVTATSHIMVTGTLALFTFLITQFSANKDYWMHIFWPPNVPVPIKFILIPVEILGMFTKPLALAFRLFGNMLSGHLVIVSILGLIFIFAAQFGAGVGTGVIFISVPLTIFIYLLKIVVSLVQAYIFTMLSAVFIGMAIEEHEHHHDEHHGHELVAVASGNGHTAELVSGDGTAIIQNTPASQPSLTGA